MDWRISVVEHFRSSITKTQTQKSTDNRHLPTDNRHSMGNVGEHIKALYTIETTQHYTTRDKNQVSRHFLSAMKNRNEQTLT